MLIFSFKVNFYEFLFCDYAKYFQSIHELLLVAVINDFP